MKKKYEHNFVSILFFLFHFFSPITFVTSSEHNFALYNVVNSNCDCYMCYEHN